MARPDLQDLFTAFLAERQALGAAALTVQSYRERCGRFLAQLPAGAALDRAAVIAFVEQLRGEGLGLHTVRGYIQSISGFCRWLVERGDLADNPTRRLAPRLPQRRPAAYTTAQLRALLQHAGGARNKALIMALLDTGLRVGELVQLRWPDVARGECSIIGKGNQERRVYLGEWALASINVYVTTERGTEPGALWLGRGGLARGGALRPLGPEGIHRIISRAATRAGIRDNVRRLVHSFRATFARSYLRAGGDLETLRALLGHSTLAMASYYAQLDDQELADKKRRIDPLANALGYGPV